MIKHFATTQRLQYSLCNQMYPTHVSAFLCAVGSVASRYTSEGFVGVYDDIIYLSFCDYIVGTFSSQVSRMAYEVSLVNNTLGSPDRTFAYHSVDSMWYYGGMTGFTRCAARDFTDQGKVKVKAGQSLTCATIHEFDQFTGYAKCKLIGAQIEVKVPPGILIDCPAADNKYRPILPKYMWPPPVIKAESTAAAAGSGAGAAAGSGAGAAAAAGARVATGQAAAFGANVVTGGGGTAGGAATAAASGAGAGTSASTAVHKVDAASRIDVA
jgi:hypothetical protein